MVLICVLVSKLTFDVRTFIPLVPGARGAGLPEEGAPHERDAAPREADARGTKPSTLHAVAQSLAIGPMFSTALLLGLISNPVTGAAERPVLLAGLGVLAIGYVVALYARRFAGAGAVYEYLTHGAHLWIGVLTAGIFFIGTLFLGGGGIYLGVGNLAEGWNTSDNGPAWWVWG